MTLLSIISWVTCWYAWAGGCGGKRVGLGLDGVLELRSSSLPSIIVFFHLPSILVVTGAVLHCGKTGVIDDGVLLMVVAMGWSGL